MRLHRRTTRTGAPRVQMTVDIAPGLQPVLAAIADAGDDPGATLLCRLAAEIRPRDPDDGARALKNLQALQFVLASAPRLREGLRDYLLRLFTTHHQTALYADLGVLPDTGFFTELWRRVAHKLLPAAVDPTSLKDALGQVFHRTTDHRWVTAIDDEQWQNVFNAIGVDFLSGRHADPTIAQLLDAVRIVSARIAAMGVHPDLVATRPALREHESPFLEQLAETLRWIAAFREATENNAPQAEDDKHLRVLLDQCCDVITRVRRNTGNTGISVALTYLLQRLAETIARMEQLLDLLDRTPADRRVASAVRLFKLLVEAENESNNLRRHFGRNTELIAREVTEHAGRTGEHYITNTPAEYQAMFTSALGAGLIVPFMALIKIGLHDLHPAPLIEAFAYSMNYALGFMLIHVLHFTIATKQPAMTASRIAAALDHPPGTKPDAGAMADLITRVVRSQVIAILGNVSFAFPLAFVIAAALHLSTGAHVMSPAAARQVLHDLHPFASLALFHAAIAGCYLFLSGLISGYHDNIAIYNRIPQRIEQLRWLERLIGPHRLHQLASYIENNLGGLAGNFWFGVFLGSTATLGLNLGLPLDIRHITFSAANLATAVVSLDQQVPWQVFAISTLGVLLVGGVNLTVSFGLALLVALKARHVRFRYARPLLAALGRRMITSPLDFVRPPRATADVPPT